MVLLLLSSCCCPAAVVQLTLSLASRLQECRQRTRSCCSRASSETSRRCRWGFTCACKRRTGQVARLRPCLLVPPPAKACMLQQAGAFHNSQAAGLKNGSKIIVMGSKPEEIKVGVKRVCYRRIELRRSWAARRVRVGLYALGACQLNVFRLNRVLCWQAGWPHVSLGLSLQSAAAVDAPPSRHPGR